MRSVFILAIASLFIFALTTGAQPPAKQPPTPPPLKAPPASQEVTADTKLGGKDLNQLIETRKTPDPTFAGSPFRSSPGTIRRPPRLFLTCANGWPRIPTPACASMRPWLWAASPFQKRKILKERSPLWPPVWEPIRNPQTVENPQAIVRFHAAAALAQFERTTRSRPFLA